MRILDQRLARGLGESTFRPLYLQVRGGGLRQMMIIIPKQWL